MGSWFQGAIIAGKNFVLAPIFVHKYIVIKQSGSKLNLLKMNFNGLYLIS